VRVLFVYKYLTLGGVEVVLRARLDGLPRLGIDAQAWFLQQGEGWGIFDGLEGRVHVGGITALRQFLEASPQHIVSTIDTPEVLPLLAQAHAGKVIVEAHTPYLENLEYLRRLDAQRVSAFWAPSDFQRGLVQHRLGGGGGVRVVPNALREAFARELRPFVPSPPQPIVAWVGRLDDLKNWRGFLEIARRIGRLDSGVEFWIAGDSPDRHEPERLLRAAGAIVAEKLFWYRSLPHATLPRWFDAVRDSGGLVLSTSRRESFGMAIAEAMARGCPVAAPAHGPFLELMEDGVSGALYRAGSTAAGAAAARDLLRNPDRRAKVGARAREVILARHGMRPALEALAQALHALVPE